MAEKKLSAAERVAAAIAGKDTETNEVVQKQSGSSLKTKSGSGQ